MNILYTTDQVQTRINELAQEIIAKYSDTPPVFVCLLKGAAPFAGKLLTAITEQSPTFHPEMEYMHISAYGTGRQAQDATTYSSLPAEAVHNRAVIVLDDCLDQGHTYQTAKYLLIDQGATSVNLIVLANKQTGRLDREEPLMSGFNVPDVWLVGMGMDHADQAPEAERWSGYIGQVS